MPDEDGDLTVPVHEVSVVLRLLPGRPALVRVWAVAAIGLLGTVKMLREVNDVNVGLSGARCFLARGGSLVVVGELEVVSIEPGELGRLVVRVGDTATRVGSMLVAVHGGRLPTARDEQFDHEG